MVEDPGAAAAPTPGTAVGALGSLPDHLAAQARACKRSGISHCTCRLSPLAAAAARRRHSPLDAGALPHRSLLPPCAALAQAQVLRHLGHRDCAAAAGVCSRWRELAADEAVWQAGYARSFPAWGAEHTLDPATQQAADALRWAGVAAAARAASCRRMSPPRRNKRTSKHWLAAAAQPLLLSLPPTPQLGGALPLAFGPAACVGVRAAPPRPRA